LEPRGDRGVGDGAGVHSWGLVARTIDPQRIRPPPHRCAFANQAHLP
jgi:hypothetical protein